MEFSKPAILVTGAHTISSAGFPALSVNCNYLEGVSQAGGVPLLAGADDAAAVRLCAGLLLTGGADIHPGRYGQSPQTDTLRCDPRRDELEFALARRFLDAGKPVLAICRGFQLLNVLLGGSLIQDIPAWGAPNHSSGVIHPVEIAPSSLLEKLIGAQAVVNSYHHQAVTPDTLAPELRPNALRREKGYTLVEGFELPGTPVLAVQWHPERMLNGREERSDASCTNMSPLFQWLCRTAAASV